jgi:multiple sugar transport system permease protein
MAQKLEQASLTIGNATTSDATLRKHAMRALVHICNGAWIVFVIFPFIAVLFAAFQSERAMQSDVTTFIPHELTLDNFILILSQGGVKGETYVFEQYLPATITKFYHGFSNSVIVAVSVTFLTLLAGSFSAYTIARFRRPWTLAFLQLNVFARFVPIIVLIIPLYVTFRWLGLLNSLHGVILAQTGFLLPFAMLILTPYFETIPIELEDAARIDGCSRFEAFVRVVLPISTPGLAATGVIMFVISWHDLVIPLILNSRAEFMTLPVVLASMVGETQIFFNLIMATTLLAVLPTVVLVLILRKYVVAGLSAGALKG